jgi:hypothetical protein
MFSGSPAAELHNNYVGGSQVLFHGGDPCEGCQPWIGRSGFFVPGQAMG